MLKVRSRLVNFRVTDEEFEKLRSACGRNGARSISEFARSVMLSSPVVDAENFSDQILSLDRRVAGLEISMSRLVEALAGSRPPHLTFEK